MPLDKETKPNNCSYETNRHSVLLILSMLFKLRSTNALSPILSSLYL